MNKKQRIEKLQNIIIEAKEVLAGKNQKANDIQTAHAVNKLDEAMLLCIIAVHVQEGDE